MIDRNPTRLQLHYYLEEYDDFRVKEEEKI